MEVRREVDRHMPTVTFGSEYIGRRGEERKGERERDR